MIGRLLEVHDLRVGLVALGDVAFVSADSSAAGASATSALPEPPSAGVNVLARTSTTAGLGAPSAGTRGGDHRALEGGLLGLEHAVGHARGADRPEGRQIEAADQRGGEVAAVRGGRRQHRQAGIAGRGHRGRA
jgi:hypothetical protein